MSDPAQSILGDHNTQVLVKDSHDVRIEISGTQVASLFVPPLRPAPRPNTTPTDLELLLATTAITSLTGRHDLWQSCLDWCTNDITPDTLSIRCITGRGGSGKTRFALELVHHLRTLPAWDARFVRFREPRPFDLWAKTSGPNHTLLVFDYAADNASTIADSLRLFAESPPSSPRRRIRILLLARTAAWDTGWLRQFAPRDTLEYPNRLVQFFHPVQPIELSPLTVEDRISVFMEAYAEAARRLSLPTQPIDLAAFSTPQAASTLKDPLTLLMAAVVGLRTGVPSALSLTRLELACQAADLLVATRIERALGSDSKLALHLAALATLTAGISEQDAFPLLQREASALGRPTPHPDQLLETLSHWLPGKTPAQLLGPIEPDIIGEAFVLGTFIPGRSSAPRLINPPAAILRAIQQGDSTSTHAVLTFLIRAIQDFCLAETGAREEPLQWLAHLISQAQLEDSPLLDQIAAALPEDSVVLRPHTYSIRMKLVEQAEANVNRPATPEQSAAASARLAGALSSRASAQAQLGQFAQAIQSGRRAAEIFQSLLNSHLFVLPHFASSLANLANYQAAVGDHLGALHNSLAAVRFTRALTQKDDPASLSQLATILTNLANRYAHTGQYQDAIQTAQEAVTLNEQLVQRDRDSFLPDLALSLGNLSNHQSDLGNHTEALETGIRSTQFYRELTQRNRDAFLPRLATSLGNLAIRHASLAQYDLSLQCSQQAAVIARELAERNPAAFLPELASALANLAICQGQTGNLPQAIETVLRSITLYQGLMQHNRDSLIPFVKALRTLGLSLCLLQQYPEAVPVLADALSLLIPYLEDHPFPALLKILSDLDRFYTIATKEAHLEPDLALVIGALRLLDPELKQPAASPGDRT